jgi:hypothetical protein
MNPNNKPQFKLTGLMKITGYFAVGAWLYSSGWASLIPIWFGLLLGVEVGFRSDYPTVLLGGCGVVLGMAIQLALMMTAVMTSHGKFFMFFKLNNPYQLVLIAMAWFLVAALFTWLITRIRKRTNAVNASHSQ